jgi:predicted DNA-binding ribbon-helix-helix protein
VLEQAAAERGYSLSTLVGVVDRDRSTDRPLASLLRIYALQALR